MPPSLDKPNIPSGVSESCLFNSHEECRSLNCGCTCHFRATINEAVDIVETGPEKSCPTCGSKRPFRETFCRIDGSRLSSLACGGCGVGREPEDKFCYKCGFPASGTLSGTPKVDIPIDNVMVQSSDNEVDYAHQVLSGLQSELGVENANVERTVEQPAGPQGSFKIVSQPNPNKVRVPAGRQVPPVKGFKLPIKPSE